MQLPATNKTILILGAGSDMATPLIQLLFRQWQPSRFMLLARQPQMLEPLSNAGRAAGHTVEIIRYDVGSPEPLQLTGVEICITYVGWLPPNNDEPEKAMLLNYTGVQHFLDEMIAHNQSTLKHVIITGSIAGVRVRPANRAYGQAKAALHRYALRLHHQYKSQIAITVVIPGYVQTRMLHGTKTPSFLTLSPERLAEKYTTWLKSKPAVVYSQPVWGFIAKILKLLPQFVVERMKK